MLCNCQRSSGVVSNVPELVRDKLEAVTRIYPSTKYVCVVNSIGELIAALLVEETPSAEVLAAISALKRSAIQFASTLDQEDCPVMHLTGETYMFSLYEVGEFLLAFYTEISGSAFTTLDLSDADSREILEIVADLRLMLQNVVIHSDNPSNKM
mmetsp:Transcript_26707/g.39681  ORF Transcript_26707/g.39681 Transcript_26707/m.39681 type:complete len:154 (+) Transcript_26707:120-581(+)